MRLWRNILFIICIWVGIAARFYGGYINREANDDHVEVVQRMLANQPTDHIDSCWECFQPPLFYKINAQIAQITGKRDRVSLLKQMQFENVFFSLLAVLLVWLLLKHQRIPDGHRLFITSFWLVNPALFGIGIQSTNDTLIILLGVAATYYMLHYLQSKKWQHAVLALFIISIAPYFKGSGIAVFLIGSIVWLVFILYAKKHRYLLIGLGLCFYLLIGHSHYTNNYHKYGEAFVINQVKAGKPPLFDDGQEFWKRPGITSIWSSYFKFRYGSLLKTPYNVNSGPNYPIHRTSFWAQLYGSFYHVQFLYHPWSWTSKHPDMLNLARVIFVLGLLPLLLFIIGLVSELWKFFRELSFDEKTLIRLIHFGFALGFLVFNLKYSYDYRDFGCIKAIFTLPALVSLTYFVQAGFSKFRNVNLRFGLKIALSILIFLCAIDVVVLLIHLS